MKSNIINKLTFRYAGVLLFLAWLAVAAYLIVIWAIDKNTGDGQLINISGRQRMLSHQVALRAEHLVEEAGGIDAEHYDGNDIIKKLGEYREELLNGVKQLEASHQFLIKNLRDAKKGGNTRPSLESLFFGPDEFLDRDIKLFIAHATNLAYTPVADLSPKNRDLQYLLYSPPGTLLRALDKLTAYYQKENESHLQFLRNIQHLFVFTTLGVLFLSAIMVFHPMTKRIEEAFDARERAEEKERDARMEAELANRIKTEFLANTSHELRTPLNSIIGFSEMMLTEAFGPLGSPRYLEYVNDIKHSGEHLLALVNDILDVSRIEAGNLPLIEDKLDTSKLLEACKRLIHPRAKKAGLDLLVEASFPMPCLYADERRVKQILINLLSNAVRFTKEGGTIAMKVLMNDNGHLVYQISDTGIGIAPDDIEKILKPFRQADGSLARKYDGAGLGLSLSKNLAELHGGSLTIESKLGVGTTVNVQFPKERIMPRHEATNAEPIQESWL